MSDQPNTGYLKNGFSASATTGEVRPTEAIFTEFFALYTVQLQFKVCIQATENYYIPKGYTSIPNITIAEHQDGTNSVF
jgi:hypothetical protein